MPTTLDRSHESTSRMRRLRAPLAVLAATLMAVTAACAPTTTPTNPTPVDPADASARSVRIYQLPKAVEVTWQADEDITSFEVQWRTGAMPTWGTQTVTGRSTTITDLTTLAMYQYRVRATPTPELANPVWSATVSSRYYEPTLPVMSINTNDQPILDKENYVAATYSLDPNGSDVAAFSGAVEIRGRGNTTWDLPKKPYRLKLANKAALMGMPSNRHWALLANYADRSQIRTTVGQTLASMTSIDWSPRSQLVEVVLNGVYQGPYQLIEHRRIDKDRINIDEMSSSDNSGEALTGGYVFEIDFRGDDQALRTSRGAKVTVSDPEPYTPEQQAYAQSVLQRFEDALFSPDFADPETGYRAYVDMESLIDSYLVAEFTMQVDFFYTSTFFYKKRGDEKFYFGPMWDFDVSVAPVTVGVEEITWPANMPWVRNPSITFNRDGGGKWIGRLFEDPTFVQAVHDRWQELKEPFGAYVQGMAAMQAPLNSAIKADSVRWDRGELGTYHRASQMQGWMNQRWNWMNSTM